MIDYLISKGFQKAKSRIPHEKDTYKFDLILRIHDIHYLVWYDNLKHFALAVKNISKKGEAGAKGYKEFNEIIIPKTVYTQNEVDNLISSIT